jgi:ABC-type transport system involved in multi-copper enzyme maturation permease subunit
MQFWALTVDSFRESLDRKIFWVMLLITLAVVVLMASIGFNEERISFVFGMWEVETEQFSPLSGLGRTRIAGIAVYFILSLILGWIGVVLTVIATASIFPSLLERGVIDVLLSKPISRPRLFIYKYLSSMVFVGFQGTVFVVLTFLVMGLRWGVWAPGYLLSVLFLVLLFSYVYCVSVFVGVFTRSTVAAILLSLGAWVGFAMVHQAPLIFETFPQLKERAAIYRAVQVISWIPPKTGDFDYLVARWSNAGTSVDVIPVGAADMSSVDYERTREIEEKELAKNQFYSIGSSLLFELVIVSLAIWKFSRQDY